MPQPRAIAVQASADVGSSRTETLLGREYLVVPVVALVEGVLQGMNADNPELALAEEFGRFASGWDGRPLVMNHPEVNGTPVSANNPDVLESYQIGFIFNTRVEDSKLLTEAWIDTDRVNTLGGDAVDVLEDIQNDVEVEVSTGLFTQVEQKSGKFNSKSYAGIWRNIVPDHLAILSRGKIGACSVADGCGINHNAASDAPRTNAAQPWEAFNMPELRTNETQDAPIADDSPAIESFVASLRRLLGRPAVGDEPPEAIVPKIQATRKGVTVNEDGTVVVDPEVFKPCERDTARIAVLEKLAANVLPEAMLDNDKRKLLQAALRLKYANAYAYVLGFNNTHIVFETYGCCGYDGYATYQVSYSIGSDMSVTLSDDAVQVVLTSEITEVKVNSGQVQEPESISTQQGEDQMSGDSPKAPEKTTEPTQTQENKSTDTPTTDTTQTAAPTANAAPAPAPRAMSTAEYLAAMPEELREQMESGMKLHTERKNSLIEGLKASGRCQFSDEELNGMKLNMLENLAKLANVPTFDGVASPRTNQDGQRQNEQNAVPPAPRIFEVAKPKEGAAA